MAWAISKAVLVVECLLVSWPAAAKRLDHAEFLRLVRPFTEKGDAAAQFKLAPAQSDADAAGFRDQSETLVTPPAAGATALP